MRNKMKFNVRKYDQTDEDLNQSSKIGIKSESLVKLNLWEMEI